MAPTCLIVQPVHPAGVARLEEAGVAARYASAPDMETVAREIGDCEAVVTRNAGLKRMAIDAAANLKVIANHGIGTNEIDVARAGELGIPIIFTPNANARSVAEHAIAMMLALAKRLREADAATRAGNWGWRYDGGMSEVSGKTLGLVGFGTIARLTAFMAKAGFGMHIVVWSPRASDDDLLAIGAQRADRLEDLLAEADIVSLHRPLREDTRHTINAAALAAMKPSAILVNTARGALIDEAALAEALKAGRIAGAGLDVFEREPLPDESPLRECESAILAPHVAGATEDALRETALQCAEQIIDVLAGRRPPHLVNPDVWDRRRNPTLAAEGPFAPAEGSDAAW
jgi:D-3-phosphoglycerate dehydrogenase